MRIFVDVDGTLTEEDGKWMPPDEAMIAKVKALIEQGISVVIWSARGAKYAKNFSTKYGIEAEGFAGKPNVIVDDKPDTLRKRLHKRIISKQEFMDATYE